MSSAAKKSSGAVSKSKVPAKAPVAAVAKKPVSAKASAKSFHGSHAHLFSKNARSFGVGRAVRPKTNLSRYVKWPKYIRLQRQRAILTKRLKVPPAIHQFAKALDKNQASKLFRLLAHLRPETRLEKITRLREAAKGEAKGASEPKTGAKPIFVKYGLNHITTLVETKKAKLVIIAHDVDPIELVVWLPALCRKFNVPYVIVKGKARLGQVVHKKTVSSLAITDIAKADQSTLEQLITNANLQYKDNASDRKKWGGGDVGIKARHVIKANEKKVSASTKK